MAGGRVVAVRLLGWSVEVRRKGVELNPAQWPYYDPNLPILVVNDDPLLKLPYPMARPHKHYYRLLSAILNHYIALWRDSKAMAELCMDPFVVGKRVADLIAILYPKRASPASDVGALSATLQEEGLVKPSLLPSAEEVRSGAIEYLLQAINRPANVVLLYTPAIYLTSCRDEVRAIKIEMGRLALGRIKRLLR